MATSYDLIFQKYMHEIRDFNLTSMVEDEMKIENKMTLSKAITLFDKCKEDLTRDDNTEEFINDLSELVQWIIADYMRKVWIDENVANGEFLKLKLTTRDYKTYSPANQLDKILEMKKVFDKELRLRVNQYLYKLYDYTMFRS